MGREKDMTDRTPGVGGLSEERRLGWSDPGVESHTYRGKDGGSGVGPHCYSRRGEKCSARGHGPVPEGVPSLV